MHVDPAVKVLATTRFPIADGPHVPNGPVEMPVVWTKLYGRGRVFYNSLGHRRRCSTGPVRADAARLPLGGRRKAVHGGLTSRSAELSPLSSGLLSQAARRRASAWACAGLYCEGGYVMPVWSRRQFVLAMASVGAGSATRWCAGAAGVRAAQPVTSGVIRTTHQRICFSGRNVRAEEFRGGYLTTVSVTGDGPWLAYPAAGRIEMPGTGPVAPPVPYSQIVRRGFATFDKRQPVATETLKGFPVWKYSWHEPAYQVGDVGSEAHDETYWVYADKAFPSCCNVPTTTASWKLWSTSVGRCAANRAV